MVKRNVVNKEALMFKFNMLNVAPISVGLGINFQVFVKLDGIYIKNFVIKSPCDYEFSR